MNLKRISPVIIATKYGARSERQWIKNLEWERGAKPLFKTQVLRKEQNQGQNLPQEKNIVCVQSVGRPLAIAQSLPNIGENTLGRRLMWVQT